jgi:hypothetical protein
MIKFMTINQYASKFQAAKNNASFYRDILKDNPNDTMAVLQLEQAKKTMLNVAAAFKRIAELQQV